MDNLIIRLRPWPGFHYSIGIVATVLLMVGCVHVLSLWTSLSAFIAGGSLLAMVNRRWDESVADVAIGLITLGIVSLSMVGLGHGPFNSAAYADIFCTAVIGLSITVFFWYWLANVWNQQLDHGIAWTTTGRLIANVRRVGYLAGATGALIAWQLAFWPLLPYVVWLDGGLFQWVCGLGAMMLLALAMFYALQSTRRTTTAWLIVLTLGAAVSFSLIRATGSRWSVKWISYWPLGVSWLAFLWLPLSKLAARRSRWQPFHEPFLFIAVLIAPLAGAAGVSFSDRLLLPAWMPTAVFGSLSVVYLLAVFLLSSRSYLILVAFCAAMAVYL